MSSKFLTTASVVVASSILAAAAPCDIYASGNTPCIAAHSSTRALYDAYNGPLYQVKRASDGTTLDITPRNAGGVANGPAQDSFCARTTCLITVLYDQSGRGNHLTQAPPGGFNGPDVNGFDNLAGAIGAPVKLNGKSAYGIFVSPGTGYRNNVVNGSAVGDEPEGMYAVLDGTHYNDACCFDYGNAETNNLDTGNGHMEAIYYGDNTIWGSGSGNGPWLMADLENGLFSGVDPKNNPADPSLSDRFLTTILKGKPNQWALRGGNAAGSKGLDTYYSGIRPTVDGYNPMSKEGAIILGIGGDNSNGAQGTFYEGAMTYGYPSDEIENLVQANIRAARYTETTVGSGPQFNIGSSISLRATTPGYNTRYLAHDSNGVVNTQVVTAKDSLATRQAASWTVRSGLGYAGCYSFESNDRPGSFIRHSNFGLRLDANDNSKQFKEDATFCRYYGLSGTGATIRAWGYPTRFIRHFDSVGYIASNGGVHNFDNTFSFNNDVSWSVLGGLA